MNSFFEFFFCQDASMQTKLQVFHADINTIMKAKPREIHVRDDIKVIY